MHSDCVLLAESGTCLGNSTHAEYVAVIRGLIAIPLDNKVTVVTDRDDVYRALSGIETRRKTKRYLSKTYQGLIRRFIRPNLTVEQIKSNKHRFHRFADAMARKACGLTPKRKKSKRKNLTPRESAV